MTTSIDPLQEARRLVVARTWDEVLNDHIISEADSAQATAYALIDIAESLRQLRPRDTKFVQKRTPRS